MPADDTTKGEHVNGEEGGAEDGTLGDTTSDGLRPGAETSQRDTFRSVGEVGGEPMKCRVGESGGGVKTVEEDGVVNCVESRR